MCMNNAQVCSIVTNGPNKSIALHVAYLRLDPFKSITLE